MHRVAISHSAASRLLMAAAVALVTVITATARELQGFRGLEDDELKAKVWVLCGRADTGAKAGVETSDSVYVESLPDREDFFIIRGDSLLWTGYHVGRRLGVLAQEPVYLCNKSGYTSDGAMRTFRCTGRLDVSTRVQERGDVSWELLGRGRAIVSPGDTINNVVLTCQRSHARFVAPDTTEVVEPTERIVYRWYPAGSMLPIAVQCGNDLFVDADAAEIVPDNDADEEELMRRIQDLIDSATFRNEGDYVVVTTAEPLELHVYIMDVPGNIYASASGYADEFVLSTADLASGQYIISIVAAPEPVYDRKILFRK